MGQTGFVGQSSRGSWGHLTGYSVFSRIDRFLHFACTMVVVPDTYKAEGVEKRLVPTVPLVMGCKMGLSHSPERNSL